MTFIKICGIRRREDVEYLNEYKPDYAGFVFARSPRMVSKDTAARLAHLLDDNIERVGVFVDQPIEFISDLIETGIISNVQLHGNEDNDYIRDLRKKCNKKEYKIIKAVRVKDKSDIIRAVKYESDYLLLDAYVKGVAGGNGVTFNWNLIEQINKPFFLAGGLNPDNIANAILSVKPFGIDASSSLETDGYKDSEKIRQFIENARNIQKDNLEEKK